MRRFALSIGAFDRSFWVGLVRHWMVWVSGVGCFWVFIFVLLFCLLVLVFGINAVLCTEGVGSSCGVAFGEDLECTRESNYR